MRKAGLLTIAGVAVVTLMGLVYLALTFDASQNGTTTVVIAPPVEPVQRQSPSSRVTTPAGNSILPEIRLQPQTDQVAPPATEPIVEPLPTEVASATPAQAETELPAAAPLPTLNESDAFVFDELRGISGGAAVVDFLVSDQIVRKFVALVENISRGEYPQTGVPYQPIGTEMQVRNIDENLFVMDDASYDRFNEVVEAFTALDTDASYALYRFLSPLLQQAYAEIGFRNQSFDDTLRSAINAVLAAEEVEGPFQLVKPSVMFLHADASIENLQEVHKLLIRIGPKNASQIKAKLREFRNRL